MGLFQKAAIIIAVNNIVHYALCLLLVESFFFSAFPLPVDRRLNLNWNIVYVNRYEVILILPTECFHVISQWPCWCSKTKERWPCWCPKLILWELDSILMLTFPFVLVEKHAHWSREWEHCIWLFFIEVLHGFIRTPKCFRGKESWAGNWNSVFSLKHNHIHNHMYSQWKRMSL